MFLQFFLLNKYSFSSECKHDCSKKYFLIFLKDPTFFNSSV